ncbi:MAG: hypothetical protein LBT98_02660 [Puniceicoccales bacterium]|jgi:hypothetical protein|nr:hypothetical protein [Puniceicoccales bacterium]
MDDLRRGMARGGFRYVAHVLADGLAADPSRERVELFFQALRSLEPPPFQLGLRLLIVLRCLGRWLRRDRGGLLRQILLWLCLAPRSRLALRSLLRLCRGKTFWDSLYRAAAEALGPEGLRAREQLLLCRMLLRDGNSAEAAALAKLLLEKRPDDAEARDLLWSALLRVENWPGKGPDCADSAGTAQGY